MAVYQVYPKKKKKSFDLSKFSITKKLIAINVLVFVVSLILISINEKFAEYIFLSREAILNGHLWVLLTSMFMHSPKGIFHLFVNMLSLFFMGNLVERIIGAKRYILLYLASGIFASLLHITFETTFAVGASGALFGLIGALIILTPNLPVYMMFIPIPVKMKYAAPGMLVLLWLLTLGTGAPIGNVAHLGGLIFGIVYGVYLKQKFPNKVLAIRRHFS